MNFRKQHIALLLFVAIIFGAIGVYAGVKLPYFDQDHQNSSGRSNQGNLLNQSTEEIEKISQAFHLIKENYIEDVEDTNLIEGAIQGMLDTLEDPYSSYMDSEMTERFTEEIESSFEGIGAEVSMVNDIVTIVAPIKDSPAEKAGLRPNDQILKIDQKSIDGLDLNEAVDKIRGERGTEVVLEIARPGTSEPFEVTLTRDEIPIETVYSDIRDVEDQQIGILEITTFAETTSEEFTTELEKMEDAGIEGLVIDVRGNPGGLLESIEDILQHFVPKDIPYIQTEDRSGKKTPFYSDLEEKKEYPITVLIDEGSASASEILAVALKEIGYEVVGRPSFGKGTVQNAIPMGDDGTLKLTFYKWLSPEGNWIHEEGVEPTVEVKQPDFYYANPIQIDDPLEYDQAGETIENVQIMLSGLDYDLDRTDGYFDETTEKAVKEFQDDHDLEVTGVVDQKTAGMIESKVMKSIRDGKDDIQLEKALETFLH